MKNILCIFPPFCSPVSPPYSITYVAEFLKRNTSTKDFNFRLFDLNAFLHYNHFKEDYKKINSFLLSRDLQAYSSAVHDVKLKIDEFSKTENNIIRLNETSSLLQESLNAILDKKPDTVLISMVYNSQAFFSLQLAKLLKMQGIEVIVGGPAATEQIKNEAIYLPHEVALLEHLLGKQISEDELKMNELKCERVLDYSGYDYSYYFIPQNVISLRTTSCCYYQKCAFCTHHLFGKYIEYNLEDIKQSILLSKSKLVFFIDDMIHKKRLLELAKITKELGVEWMCQLRPMKELDFETLKTLHDGGLKVIIWGVESGNQRILDLMQKGTNPPDVEMVLDASKRAGIVNVTYIMFGFPTETKEEFLDTINFLKKNKNNIDLISTSVFGLHEGSIAEKNPGAFSIKGIHKEKRTMLPDKISYSIDVGLDRDEARELRKKYMKSILAINKFPKEMNIYREHMLLFVSKSLIKSNNN